MAIELYISDDGATGLVRLSDTDAQLLAYVPREPELDTRSLSRIGEDGDTLFSARYKNVQERCEFIITGGATDATDTLQRLQRLCWFAHRYATTRVGAQVYVYFRPDLATTLYRSPLFQARIELDDDVLDYQYLNGVFQVTIEWERAFYWEPQSETQLSLSNSGTASTLSPVTIYAHDDGDAGHDNYVQIAGDDVDGVVQSPAIITLVNNYNVAQAARKIYVAHRAAGNADLFTHILEGENATGSGSNSASGSASNGNYRSMTWSGTAEATLGTWTISTAQANVAAGLAHRVLVRLHGLTAYTDLYMRLQMSINSVVHHSTAWALVNSASELQELESFPLPPRPSGNSHAPWSLLLNAKRATSGNHSLAVDFLQLSPLHSWRKYVPIANLAYNTSLRDEGDENEVWTFGAGSFVAPSYYAEGKPIMLTPTLLQRVYFLRDQSDGNAPIAATLQATISYRPRRLTL